MTSSKMLNNNNSTCFATTIFLTQWPRNSRATGLKHNLFVRSLWEIIYESFHMQWVWHGHAHVLQSDPGVSNALLPASMLHSYKNQQSTARLRHVLVVIFCNGSNSMRSNALFKACKACGKKIRPSVPLQTFSMNASHCTVTSALSFQ